MSKIAIDPITSRIGAYVRIAPENVLDDGIPEQIMAALNRYNVLVFPQVHMTDDQFVGLSDHFGEKHDLALTQDGSETSAKGIYRIEKADKDKNQLDYIRGNDLWHMDGTIYNVPGKSTMLKCERPASKGGDTQFASLFAAYAALPEARKAEIEKLRVIHCFEAVGVRLYDAPTQEDFARWDAAFPETEQPLVWHQRDGRTSLLIGGTAFHGANGPDRQAQKTSSQCAPKIRVRRSLTASNVRPHSTSYSTFIVIWAVRIPKVRLRESSDHAAPWILHMHILSICPLNFQAQLVAHMLQGSTLAALSSDFLLCFAQ